MNFASRFPKMRLIFGHTGVTVYPYSNYRAGMNMHTSGYANRATSLSSAAGNVAQNSVERVSTGLISEVVYREDQPLLTQLLLPLQIMIISLKRPAKFWYLMVI